MFLVTISNSDEKDKDKDIDHKIYRFILFDNNYHKLVK